MSKLQPSSGDSVCNAESECVSKSLLLSFLDREASTIRNLQSVTGIAANHPTKSGRERFEITQAKLLVVSDLRRKVEDFPCASVETHGEENLSSAVSERLEVLRRTLGQYRALVSDLRNPTIDIDRLRIVELEASILELSRLQETLSGNAEEQPGTRENARELIGTPPVTAPALTSEEVPPPISVFSWLPDYSVPELVQLSEFVLEELDSRPDSPTWGISENAAAAGSDRP